MKSMEDIEILFCKIYHRMHTVIQSLLCWLHHSNSFMRILCTSNNNTVSRRFGCAHWNRKRKSSRIWHQNALWRWGWWVKRNYLVGIWRIRSVTSFASLKQWHQSVYFHLINNGILMMRCLDAKMLGLRHPLQCLLSVEYY